MSTATNKSWAKEQAPSRTEDSTKSMSAKKGNLRNDVVRDDWEDDDEDEDEDENPVAVVERNKQIWNEANSKESRPMPSVVMSRGLSIPSTSFNLPLNEPPTMRILKRPSPSTNVPSNMNATGESLQDREARYVAARERIFGASTPEDEPTEEIKLHPHFGENPSLPSSTFSSQVIRELRGPSLGDGTNPGFKGFVHRGAGRSKNTVSPPSKGRSEDTSL